MIYFISDQHLGLGNRRSDKAREYNLIKFLTQIKPHCERLFILGDLFDYWFEYRTVVQKHHIRTLAALTDLADGGIPIDYLIGNHDFGHDSFFRDELGITIHAGDLDVELHGQRFYLAHGDGKAPDTTYRIIRSVLRHPVALWAWKTLHPDIGIRTAAYFSRQSRTEIDENDPKFIREFQGLESFAEEKIKQGYHNVIMGHVHKATQRTFTGEGYAGTYTNIGTWLTTPTFAEFNGTHVCLRTLEEFLREF